jgi:DNA-directed RNA polymerase subunit RPC12/RpoP
MPIEFRCSECSKLLQTSDGTAGRQARCPECGAILMIPTLDGASQPGPEPPAAAGDGMPSAASPFGPQDTFQPQGGSPGVENPYQSPQAGMMPGAMPQPAGLRRYALDRVAVPATILIVLGALAIPVDILLAAFNIIVRANGPGANFPNPAFENMFQMSPLVVVLSTTASLAVGILMIIGGLKMKKLESYGLCLTAAIIAILPCFTPCCCLEIPFGIWALVVLLNSQVSAAFKQ